MSVKLDAARRNTTRLIQRAEYGEPSRTHLWSAHPVGASRRWLQLPRPRDASGPNGLVPAETTLESENGVRPAALSDVRSSFWFVRYSHRDHCNLHVPGLHRSYGESWGWTGVQSWTRPLGQGVWKADIDSLVSRKDNAG